MWARFILLMPIPSVVTENICALCGSNDRVRMLYPSTITKSDLNPDIFSARRAPDRLHGDILRCDGCGLVFPRHFIDPETLQKLYAESKCTYGSEEPFIRTTYARYLRQIKPLLADQSQPLAYLDIGCGSGFMLEEARAQGFDQVCGIEPGVATAAAANTSIRDQILVGMFSPALIGHGRFDVITCFQTLDHIPDPVGFVRDCHAVLKPGGSVLFINHNIGSWTARVLGERCPMIDVEHTFLHTPETMKRLFERTGFRDIDVFPVRNDYPLRYWVHLLPLVPRSVKKILMNILSGLKLADVILPLSVGNLGLIARK